MLGLKLNYISKRGPRGGDTNNEEERRELILWNTRFVNNE